MSNYRISSETGLYLTKGLFESLQLERDGKLSLPILSKTEEELGNTFGQLTIVPEVSMEYLSKILVLYANWNPRGADIQKICGIVNPPAPAPAPAADHPKFTAMKTMVGGFQDDLEAYRVWAEFLEGLHTATVFLVDKMKKAVNLFERFSELRQLHGILQDNVVQRDLLDISRNSLREEAKSLMEKKKGFKLQQRSFASYEPGAATKFAVVLGYAPHRLSWQNLKTAQQRGNILNCCQVGTDSEFSADELTETLDNINSVIREVSAIPAPTVLPSIAKNATLQRDADKYLAKAGEERELLASLDEVDRQMLYEDIGELEKHIHQMRLQGESVILDEDTLEALRVIKKDCTRLNVAASNLRAQAIKFEENKQIQAAKAVPNAKLVSLKGHRNWLTWRSAYAELTSGAVPENKKLSLILGSLGDPQDKKACSNQPLSAVMQYLVDKYNNLDLIVTTHIQDLLKLSRPKGDQDMIKNIQEVLGTYNLLREHNKLSRFDSGFIDTILLHTLTESEDSEYLKESLKKKRTVLSSTRLNVPQGGKDIIAASMLEDESEDVSDKREFFIEYISEKMSALRVIKSQKDLLHHRTGDKAPKGDEIKGVVSDRDALVKSTKKKKKQPTKPSTQGSGDANRADRTDQMHGPVRCVNGCEFSHMTGRGNKTLSLAFCPKFKKAEVKEREKMAAKIKDFCRTCCSPRSTHRGRSGCWIKRLCHYCKGDHSPLLCTVDDATKKAIDASLTQ